MLLAQSPFRCLLNHTLYHHAAKPSSPDTLTTRTRRTARRRKKNHPHPHFHFPALSRLLHHTPSPLFQLSAVPTEVEHRSGLVICADNDQVQEDRCLPVEVCSTRDLGACLTVKEGYDKLKEALEHEKLSASSSSEFTAAVIQYRVLLPPSARALDWLCCQKTALPVYPHCYFSSSHQPNGFLRFSSFGRAVCIHGSGSTDKGYHLLSRYLSPEVLTLRAYGFTGLSLCTDVAAGVEEQDLFSFFIPQIELRELDGCTMLAATLIWDDLFSFPFDRAVYLLESALDQMGHNIYPKNIYERERWMSYNCAKENVLESGISRLLCMDGEIFAGVTNTRDGCMLKKELLICDESYVCTSPTRAFAFNMFHNLNQSGFSIERCSNINMVWASLIVEELVRLGINYFCIAPGSRSSPLAINATRHPLTNCISCYDERSLAFHALGYACGSHMPAVVITSSGTAVSNLLPAVVEASQNFIPIIILSADRPPELLGCGANQAIDQV